jgi:hypothetical protein
MNAAEALRSPLESTRDEEVDCDRFLEYLAPLLDGRIDDPFSARSSSTTSGNAPSAARNSRS